MIDKNKLRHEYITLNKTAAEIAKECHCTIGTIFKHLNKHGISKVDKLSRLKLTREILTELYINQCKSISQIATILGVSKHLVNRTLKKHDIPIRKTTFYQTDKRQTGYLNSRKGYQNISGSYWGAIQRNAKKRNISFNITIQEAWNQWVHQDGKCALSGTQLHLVKVAQLMVDKLEEQTASLDRIDSSKGYEPDNIQWIHKKLQVMKWTYTNEEFFKWCKLITYHMEQYSANNISQVK